MTTPPTGTITFLFTDLEGSSRRWDRDRAAMEHALARHDALIRTAVEAHHGYVFHTAGDAFGVAFTSPDDALAAAIAAQRGLAAADWSAVAPGFEPLSVRMGLHTGLAELRDGDYFGPPLNRAARLMSAGHGGQVLLSLATQQLVRDRLPQGVTLRDLGAHRLKDLRFAEHIYQLVVVGLADVATPPTTAEALPVRDKALVDADFLPPECPYRGLLAFREADSPFFFGREAFTELLVEAVAAAPMVGVIGPSGSGKSSVVFAGLVPRLRAANGVGDSGWTVIEMRPGSRPYQALAGALVPWLIGPDAGEVDRLVEVNKLAGYLRDGSVSPRDVLGRIGDKHPELGRLLLVADQFEELYTLCPDEAEHRAFQDLLFAAAFEANGGPPLTLALTLRADFMGHALAYRPFADAIQKHDVKLGPMTRDELARAIRLPAEKQGRTYESGLVERIVDDVGEKVGTLPLLEFALTKLWEQQEAGWLTHAAYENSGRVEGAVARYADAVYGTLNESEQERSRRVFVQLVQPGEGTEDTRRLATKEELGADWPLVRRLADARLVTTSRDETGRETAEVVHEALIRSWQRLREWMNADRRFRMGQERLRFALRQWEAMGRDEGALLRGVPLAEAEGWLAERSQELTVDERAFVAAALAVRDREAREREARIQRELMAARKLRRLAVGLAVVGLMAVVMAGLAMIARQAATREARDSRARELAAAALANLDIDPQRSTLLALQAISVTATSDGIVLPEVVSALHRSVPALHQRVVLRGAGRDLNRGAAPLVLFALDGKRVFTEASHVVTVWDAVTGRVLATLAGHSDAIRNFKSSPNGQQLATYSDDHTAVIWDIATGHKLTTLRGQGAIISLNYSPDGARVVTGGSDQTARVWEVATGREVLTLRGHTGALSGGADFSPDGDRVVTGSADQTVRMWDATTGRLLQTFVGHGAAIRRITFSPDGRSLATVDADKAAKMWDVETGRELFSFAQDPTSRGYFSPDGTQLATRPDANSAVVVLNSRTGQPLRAFGGDQGALVFRLAPDGTIAATTGADSKVRIWDMQSSRLLGTRVGQAGTVYGLDFSPDGRSIVTRSPSDPDVIVWDVEPDREWLFIKGSSADVAFSPDSRWLATAGPGAEAVVWDAATGNKVRTLIGSASDVDFSPDGKYLATAGGDDKSVRVWDVATGAAVKELCCHRGFVQQVTFSPDGHRLATASADKSAKIWDAATGCNLKTLNGHSDAVHAVVFSPDGQQLATVSEDATARTWDAMTGAPISTFTGHSGPVNYAGFSPDSRRLATASADDTIGIWDITKRTRVRSIGGLMGGVYYIAFAPDGRTLVGVGSNGAIRAWDMANGQEQFTIGGNGAALAYALAISTDGRQVAVASAFGTNVYDLRLPDLIALAHSRLTRTLTPEECRHYLHVEACPADMWRPATEDRP